MATPPPLDTDAEDVVWALQTAESLWKRDERADALTWVRRAAQAAGEAEDDDRALSLARAAAELTDDIQSSSIPAPPPDLELELPPEVPPPPAPRMSIDILIEDDASSGPAADPDDGVVTSAPSVAKTPPPAPKKPPPRKPPPPRPKQTVPPQIEAGAVTASTGETAAVRRASVPPPPRLETPVDETITEWPPSDQTPLFAADTPPPAPAPTHVQRGVRSQSGALGLPSRSRTVPGGYSPDEPSPSPSPERAVAAEEPAREAFAHAAPPAEAHAPHAADAHYEGAPRPSSGSIRPPAIEIEGDLLGTPEPPKPKPTPPAKPLPSRNAPPRPPPRTTAAPQPTPPPPAASPIPAAPPVDAPLDLAGVVAFADLPDDVREVFARAARVIPLAADEEEAGFALAYVVRGELDVAAAVVDTPAARLRAGDVLRARGTVDSAIALRVIGVGSGARVAVWDDDAIAAAFGPCPWVEDELRAASDRFQALAGATMGLLADKLDVALRDALLASLETRVLAEGEIIAEAGDSVPGVLVVGVGFLELVANDHVTGKVGSGEFLFPLEVLGGAKARATARAGKGGAVLLMGGKQRTQELVVTYPSLLEILAGM